MTEASAASTTQARGGIADDEADDEADAAR